MKALDTSVLLSVLHGERNVRELLRRLRGVEVATTELNLLELQSIANRGPAKARAHRRAAIDRLRRTLTVLPYDGRAAERMARRPPREDFRDVSPLVPAMLGILEANGCDELFTADPSAIPGRWSYRVTRFVGSLR